MATITEILGAEEARNLQEDFDEAICNGADYDEIEDLMLDYGLEMDYVMDLICY